MTGAPSAQQRASNIPDNIYPQYCFHLSPTINRWCPLRAADVQVLDRHPGFEGQDVYFHGNHPIKWVRIVGVVVGIDEYAERHIYTVDDSSGASIECVVTIPKPKTSAGTAAAAATALPVRQQEEAIRKGANATATMNGSSASAETAGPDIDGDVDVGDILDVRGSIKLFRQFKQIRVQKIIHLRSTEQEVRFWNKLTQFRKDILDKPWTLDRRDVRRCRKEAEGSDEALDRERRKRRAARAESSRRPARDGSANEHDRPSTVSNTTGLERKTKRRRKPIQVEGKYGALGI